MYLFIYFLSYALKGRKQALGNIDL